MRQNMFFREHFISLRKAGVAVILLLEFLSFMNIACVGKSTDTNIEAGKYTSGVWIDNDTFRISTAGAVNPRSLTGIEERKAASKKSAAMVASYMILEKFKQSLMSGAAAIPNYSYKTDSAITKELKGIVKSGKVLNAQWDDEQNCEIIYEIKSKGLKKKIRSWILYLPD